MQMLRNARDILLLLMAVLLFIREASAQKYIVDRIAGGTDEGWIHVYDSVVFQNELYYARYEADGTGDIYRTNGETSELVQSFEFSLGIGDAVTFGPILGNELLYRTGGGRFYRIGHASETTLRAADPSIDLTDIRFMTEFNGHALFYGTDSSGTRLFRLEHDGLNLVDNLSGTGDDFDNFIGWTVFQNELLISAKGPLGHELYRTDGYGFELVADIRPGPESSNPGFQAFPVAFRQVGEKLYFPAQGLNGSELHSYDGATVQEVADIRPGEDWGDRVRCSRSATS